MKPNLTLLTLSVALLMTEGLSAQVNYRVGAHHQLTSEGSESTSAGILVRPGSLPAYFGFEVGLSHVNNVITSSEIDNATFTYTDVTQRPSPVIGASAGLGLFQNNLRAGVRADLNVNHEVVDGQMQESLIFSAGPEVNASVRVFGKTYVNAGVSSASFTDYSPEHLRYRAGVSVGLQ